MIEQLRAARWFGGKNRAIRDTRVLDRARWLTGSELYLIEVEYAAGAPETYVVADRLEEREVARAIVEQFDGAAIATERGGFLRFRPTHIFHSVERARLDPVSVLRGEQSNTSVRFGDALILKLFRRLQFGPNPDVEIGWFLTEQTSFRGTPAVAGSAEYAAPDGRTASLALLQCFQPNRGDAWTTTLGRLANLLSGGASLDMAVAPIATLGRTTAELHLALCSGTGDFGAEAITRTDVSAWMAAIHDEVRTATEALAEHAISVDSVGLLRRADGIAALEGALKTRHHGDYHLGQVLEREDGSWAIIDFEGEPAKPLALRREKRSPLRDVAGMLRSFDYARHAALRAGDASDAARARRAHEWYTGARTVFLRAYLDAVGREQPRLLPADPHPPLAALELEKAAYEVLYELNNRPDWLPIPLAALTATL